MRKQRILTLTVVALVVVLLSAGPVLAGAIKIPFCWKRCGPNRVLDPPQNGTVNVSDGVNHVRNRGRQATIVECDGTCDPYDPEYEPIATYIFFFNTNWKAPDTDAGECSVWGPQWGTFSIVMDGETSPSWEGTFTGNGDNDGYRYQELVGQGIGDFDGLKMKAFIEIIDPGCPQRPAEADWYFDGYILNPGGKF